jgi:hypothetical protein
MDYARDFRYIGAEYTRFYPIFSDIYGQKTQNVIPLYLHGFPNPFLWWIIIYRHVPKAPPRFSSTVQICNDA